MFSIYGVSYLCYPSACVNSVAQSVVVVMCKRPMMRIVSLLSLLWSLVEVHSQRFPRLSFRGQTLANHSYVNISQVGRPDGGGEGVQCITDLTTCCRGADGSHRGDWYFPDGDRLPFAGSIVDTFEVRVQQGVDIRRNTNANSPTGIYRCDIPTNAVHHATDTSVRDTPVYVGLYTASGGIDYYHFLLDIWITKSMNASMIYLFCPHAWPIPANSFTHLTLLCFAD